MPSRRPIAASLRHSLVVLLALTLVGFLLPSSWTGRLINLVQVIVPFQDAAASAVDGLIPARGDSNRDGVSQEACEECRREKQALEHHIAALAMRVDELQRDVSILTATRLWDVGGRVGEKGRLIPAKVIVDDLLPWRSSRLLNAGSLQGVQRGAAVASRFFTVKPEGAGVQSGMAVLLGEAFVGVVEQVGTHSARVKLLSDITVQMKVRIGRLGADGFVPVEREFWLTGRGQNVMEIADAEWREIEERRIERGDLVLSDPTSESLPAAMAIGRIASVRQDSVNPLLAILTVQPALDAGDLRRVYVFDPAFQTTP